ncbi:hypothetical protein E4634_00635 [Mangrovimicrobium sediminis]|uniref:Exo-alpha-sialidase n=2 Tax=Mangrovimicrobium sediminis TaxID=2562682 RepID=A0A4Z0M9S7_9GAMM|nr:hypothetical protein E4634_00635 [Haliea sp. SAOS-164]
MKFNKVGINPGLAAKDFRRIARGGFGDGHNAYAHSMAYFRGKIYVGTTRGNFPLMKARLPIGMNPWPVECPENPFDLDLHAQIWCYDPLTDQWEMVYRSPTIIGDHGKPIPRELGLRGMAVFQAAHETEPALYVATWSPAKGPGCLVLRTVDGRTFEPSCEPGLGGLPVTVIRTLIEFKGKLYTSPAGSRGGNPNVAKHSVVFECADPAGGIWKPVSELGFGDPTNRTVFEMIGFGDHLYVSTLNLEGGQIWRSTLEGEEPYEWEKVIELGAYRGELNQAGCSMLPFKGALYIGTGIQGGGVDTQNGIGPAASEVFRIHPDGSWDLIVGEARDTPDGYKEPLSGYRPGFDNYFNGYFWRMVEHEGWLYLGTFSWNSLLGYARRENWPDFFSSIVSEVGERFIMENQCGFDLYRTFDGENWVPVTITGFNNPFNAGLRTFASTEHGLFLGTANPFGPRVRPIGEEELVDNPDGGCEVYLGKHLD